jgi:sigma54-dependent transcription regulator
VYFRPVAPQGYAVHSIAHIVGRTEFDRHTVNARHAVALSADTILGLRARRAILVKRAHGHAIFTEIQRALSAIVVNVAAILDNDRITEAIAVHLDAVATDLGCELP